MVIEKFSNGIRGSLTSKTRTQRRWENNPCGDPKQGFSSACPGSAILILFCLALHSPQPAQLYMVPLDLYGKYLRSACHSSLQSQNEDEVVAHVPWLMGSGRREPMVFSSICLVPSLIRDIALLAQFSFLFSTLWAWPKGFVESKTYSLCHGSPSIVYIPGASWGGGGGRLGRTFFYSNTVSVCCVLLSFLFLLPSLPLSMLSHCVGFPSSFLPSSSYVVYILYQDLQTAELEGCLAISLLNQSNCFLKPKFIVTLNVHFIFHFQVLIQNKPTLWNTGTFLFCVLFCFVLLRSAWTSPIVISLLLEFKTHTVLVSRALKSHQMCVAI